jgi:hypothetical protein
MNRLAVPLLLLAACASSPTTDLRREAAPELESREESLQRAEQRRRDYQFALVKLDQMMESYAQALANRGTLRADQQIGKLEKAIRDTVLDLAPVEVGKDAPPHRPGENYRRLQASAADGSKPAEQAIALAALGFSGQVEVMPTILQGAQLADPQMIMRAVFGLAVLRAPSTPPGVLAAIVENTKLDEANRTQAAWAIYNLQDVSERKQEIVAIWRRLLTEQRDTLPAGVTVQAVRGLGLARDEANTELVATFLKHPVPKVREVAAVALGRLNAQKHADDLIELIGPKESVPNVRLAARKALQELAGQQDYGYDVAAWRKAFDRGR